MAPRLQNTNSLGAVKLDILNYGLPDTEKTLAIGRMQALGLRPLVFACDPKGVSTLAGFGVDFYEVDSVRDGDELLTMMRTGKINLSQYDVVCVDGASNYSYMSLKETEVSSDVKDRRLDFNVAEIAFRRFIDDVRRLPKHIYVNAFITQVKDAPEGARFGAMAEGNKASIKFTGLFNTVLHSFRYFDANKNSCIAVQTRFDGVHLSRHRSMNANLNSYENNVGDIVQKILSSHQS